MITIEAATDAWLGTKSPNTQRSYRAGLTAWREFCARQEVDELAPSVVDIDVYKTRLLAAMAPSSAAQRMAALGSWHDYLRLNGLISSQATRQAARVKFDRHYSPTRSLSVAEVAKMLIEADRRAQGAGALSERQRYVVVRDAAIVRLLVTLGLREAEVASLDMGALGVDGGERVLEVAGKGGRRTRRFVPQDLYAALQRYFELAGHSQGPMFRAAGGDRMDPTTIYYVVRRAGQAAGVADVHPHMLRHSMAGIATEAGAESDALQHAMGHQDPKTTRRYQHGVDQRRRDPSRLVARELAAYAA